MDISSSFNDKVLSQRDLSFSFVFEYSSGFKLLDFNFIMSSNSHKFSLSNKDL